MYVKTLSLDEWVGERCGELELVLPSETDIAGFLRRLDAVTHTLLTLNGPEESHLAIGGGGGQYVVYATYDNEVFHNLTSDRPPCTGTEQVFVGGQMGDYLKRRVIGREAVTQAALTFAESGTLDSRLAWEVD